MIKLFVLCILLIIMTALIPYSKKEFFEPDDNRRLHNPYVNSYRWELERINRKVEVLDENAIMQEEYIQDIVKGKEQIHRLNFGLNYITAKDDDLIIHGPKNLKIANFQKLDVMNDIQLGGNTHITKSMIRSEDDYTVESGKKIHLVAGEEVHIGGNIKFNKDGLEIEKGSITVNSSDPGILIEKTNGSNRYGIGDFQDETTRLYSTSSKIKLGFPEGNSYNDVLTIDNKKNVSIKKTLQFGEDDVGISLDANSLMMSGKSGSGERRVGIKDRLDIYGKLCIEDMCLTKDDIKAFKELKELQYNN
jgi:hypothetical protein